MPDFSHESAVQFWSEFMGGSVAQIIEFVEHTEDWVKAHEKEVAPSLKKLGDFLDTATESTNLPEDDLVKICAVLHLSQKLRIMQVADTVSPGLASKMIQAAEQNAATDENAKIFLQRNLIFERMRILSRLLSPQRIQLVQKIYESH